jgi:hypothetical protein
MAAGVLDAGGAVPAAAYSGELTLSVLVTCLVAASGGLIFGYDIGISGLCSSPSLCIRVHDGLLGFFGRL